MTKTKNSKTGLAVGIALALVLAIVLSTLIYVFFCVDIVNSKRDTVIKYSRLQAVTKDTMLYLSDNFRADNGLEILPVDPLYFDATLNKTYPIGDVVLEYDTHKISTAFSNKTIKTDLYRYELASADNRQIPVRVSVVGAVGVNNKRKYDSRLDSGDSYAILDDSLTTYFTGIGKSYEIKGQVGKRGVIKQYSRLKITVTVDAKAVPNYSDEQIENRIDYLLNSALHYIIRYGKA